MAGNARKGPHCIGIVFLCQKWRLWGLFFAGRNFAAKSMLPPIRKNVFLAAGQSAFLELLALQKGPIAPFSAMTPLLGRNETYRYLLAICGIGPKTASELAISVNIDDFPNHDRLASYCGLAPRNRQSGTSVSSVSASRQGNKRLKNLLIFSCNCLARTDGRWGEYYARCRDRGMPHGKALKSVARKRLKVIYAVMRDKVPYVA